MSLPLLRQFVEIPRRCLLPIRVLFERYPVLDTGVQDSWGFVQFVLRGK